MEQLPLWIPATFVLATLLTVVIFLKATRFNKTVWFILLGWLCLQGIITLSGFYQVTTGKPPRFVLLALPPVIFITLLFLTAKGRQFMDRLNAKLLILLHVVRVLVEMTFYGLYIHHWLPLIMTFEGHNLDILSGITAPIVWYAYFRKGWLKKWALIVWNIACLGLLINIVIIAVLSAPFAFQQFGFEQPNIALGHFPYSWLPSLIVPLVLLSHLVMIRQLLFAKK